MSDLAAGYEALAHGDQSRLREQVTPAFELVEPDGSVRRGVDEAMATLAQAELVVEHVAAAGELTLVTGSVRAAGAELPFAHVWEAADSAFVRLTTYFDNSRLTTAATRKQLAEAADALLDQAAEIRRQWDRLGDALRAAGLDGQEDEAPSGWTGGSARLVAVDMVHEGSSREEVEAFLRDELGVEDVDAILDEVFAAGGDEQPPDEGEAKQAAEAHRIARLFARNRD